MNHSTYLVLRLGKMIPNRTGNLRTKLLVEVAKNNKFCTWNFKIHNMLINLIPKGFDDRVAMLVIRRMNVEKEQVYPIYRDRNTQRPRARENMRDIV